MGGIPDSPPPPPGSATDDCIVIFRQEPIKWAPDSVSCFLSCKNSCENVRGLKNISIRVDLAWFTINDERQFVPLNQDFS